MLSGALVGFLLFDGFWLYKLYSTFGNPFFPYFNDIFHSDLINFTKVYNVDFEQYKTTNILTAIFSQKYIVSDIRLPIFFILFFINLVTIPFVKKEKFREYFNINTTYIDFILIFVFLCYFVWMNTFGEMRYFASILALTGIILIYLSIKFYYIFSLFMQKFLENDKTKKIYLAVMLVFLLIIFFPNYKLQPEQRLTRIPAKERLIEVEDLKIPDNSKILLQEGTAIIVPFQNKNAKYIHLTNRVYTDRGVNLFSDEKLNEIKNLLKSNPNNIYYLTEINTKTFTEIDRIKVQEKIKKQKKLSIFEAAFTELEKLNINPNTLNCKEIKCNFQIQEKRGEKGFPDFYFCKAELKKETE